MEEYFTHILPCGLRVVFVPCASPVVYCGIAVAAGTRHELSGEEGLAHFCEHLSFKGTGRRSAVQVINSIEGIGGELNAFTGKEDTAFYAAVQKEHLRVAIDVLFDIVFNSTYPQHEVEKEVEVVCDEIESFEDSPSELIFDEMENLLFEGHPLGHTTLGKKEQLRTYTSNDARRFTQRCYLHRNSVFFVSGDINERRMLRLVERAVQSKCPEWGQTGEPCKGIAIAPQQREVVRQRGTHQAHVLLSTITFSAKDPRRWPLFLLNNLLGGPGLNSRFSLSLRERHGLVYGVDSSMVLYGDTGHWDIYFGCDASDVARCCRLVRRELDRVMQSPLSPRQMSAAKRQLKGQLAIASDQRESYLLDRIRNYLHHDEVAGLSKVIARIDALTAEDLLQTARELFAPDRFTTLVYK